MNKYIETPTVVTISGSNRSGKTNLIRYFIYTIRFHHIIVLSNTAGFTCDYDAFKRLKNFHIFDSTQYEQIIMKTIAHQKKMVMKFGKPELAPKVLFIFDDVVGSIKNTDFLKSFASQNRHYNTTILFSVQTINSASTLLREISRTDIVFDLKTQNSLKAGYENYFATEYSTFKEFKEDFIKRLQRYQFFFIDKINGKVLIMIAPLV